MNDNTTLDEATLARQALQESMDLRDQGHTDDLGLTHRDRPSRSSTGWDGRPHPDTPSLGWIP